MDGYPSFLITFHSSLLYYCIQIICCISNIFSFVTYSVIDLKTDTIFFYNSPSIWKCWLRVSAFESRVRLWSKNEALCLSLPYVSSTLLSAPTCLCQYRNRNYKLGTFIPFPTLRKRYRRNQALLNRNNVRELFKTCTALPTLLKKKKKKKISFAWEWKIKFDSFASLWQRFSSTIRQTHRTAKCALRQQKAYEFDVQYKWHSSRRRYRMYLESRPYQIENFHWYCIYYSGNTEFLNEEIGKISNTVWTQIFGKSLYDFRFTYKLES